MVPWTGLNQQKYGPNMCGGEGRCETGLYGAETAIQASTVKTLEQHKCGHTPFLITQVANKLCISFIPMIISYVG